MKQYNITVNPKWLTMMYFAGIAININVTTASICCLTMFKPFKKLANVFEKASITDHKA